MLYCVRYVYTVITTKRVKLMTKKQRAVLAVEAMKKEYPDAVCSLESANPHELLIAVRLSAQCTDARVNMVTPELFSKYPSIEAFAQADPDNIADIIHSCGFYKIKSRDIVLMCQMLLERFGGKVPDTIEQLVTLPGVGRKTANLIVGDVYGKPAVVADTHLIRISGRLGLTDGTKDPLKVEIQLRKILPENESNDFCHRIVLHGRAVCTARSPKCDVCVMREFCRHASNVN